MHTTRQTAKAIENETIIFFKISYPFSKIIGIFSLVYTKDSDFSLPLMNYFLKTDILSKPFLN